jgi:hypothetical protein
MVWFLAHLAIGRVSFWQPCWISNQHQKHKSGRGPSSEHFWQVWLISVQSIGAKNNLNITANDLISDTAQQGGIRFAKNININVVNGTPKNALFIFTD